MCSSGWPDGQKRNGQPVLGQQTTVCRRCSAKSNGKQNERLANCSAKCPLGRQ